MAWTDEQKKKVIELYKEGNPTPENSTEIIKSIAEQMEQTPNGVRMILIQAGEYVKKAEATTPAAKTTKAGETKTASTRVSKESQITALKELIKEKGGTVDDEILDKLTGKAAAYLVAQFS